jgi:hypothetical protein
LNFRFPGDCNRILRLASVMRIPDPPANSGSDDHDDHSGNRGESSKPQNEAPILELPSNVALASALLRMKEARRYRVNHDVLRTVNAA